MPELDQRREVVDATCCEEAGRYFMVIPTLCSSDCLGDPRFLGFVSTWILRKHIQGWLLLMFARTKPSKKEPG